MPFIRGGHGNGRGKPRVEIVPDELARGIAAPLALVALPAAPRSDERTSGGTFTKGSNTAQRNGARKSAETRRQLKALRGLGLKGAPPTELAPYLEDIEAFAAHEIDRLGRNVGGGVCGAAPASLVQSAALQLGASRAAFARGDSALGSKLANESRGNLCAAHELCAREAQARPKAPNALLAALTAEEP